MEELNQVQENLETTKPKKKIKTSEEIKWLKYTIIILL